MGVFNILFFILFFGICIASLFGIPVILIYCCAVFFRTATRVSKVEKKLSDILMNGEDVLEKAVQLRPFAFFKRRMLIAITNSRVILISRGLFGGFSMKDFQWKDLQDAVISENVLPNLCGSNLTFNAQQKKIAIAGIPSGTAASIYSKSQAEEQAWEEKRRIRDLEEKRAVAGGVVVHSSPSKSDNETSNNNVVSVTVEIEKAKKLLDSGAISDAEFQEIKSKILSKHF